MKVLDLFSGIGGFSLGLERAGMETVAFCEYDEACRQVLKKHWPDVPQYTDVRTLTGEQIERDGITVDVICGGFPCQPFSQAGHQRGAQDDRHLWPEMFRIIEAVRPAWVIGENTPPFLSMGFDEAADDLEAIGYKVQSFIIPACAVNAIHRRDRLWFVAYAESGNDGTHYSESTQRQEPKPREGDCGNIMGAATMPDPHSGGGEDWWNMAGVGWQLELDSPDTARVFAHQPYIRRGDDALPGRVDRIKQLGNSVDPRIPEIIGRAIMAADNRNLGNLPA